MLVMVDPKQAKWYTVWHEIFAGVSFCGLVIYVLRKPTRTHWFFSLRINFCGFQIVPSTPSLLAEVSHDEAKMRGKMRDLC